MLRSTRAVSQSLFIPADLRPGRMLLKRIAILLTLVALVLLMLWVERDGLKDHHHDGELSFTDVLYFAMVFSWEGLGHSGIHRLWLHRSGNEEGRTADGLL